jgi:hypothetical protein
MNPKKLTIADTIVIGLRSGLIVSEDGIFGVEQLTRFVREIRGKWVMDGTVTRELRRYNENASYNGYDIKWEVVKGGVYRLLKITEIKKELF